jgi:autotransporter translocation and assembly factor TamB
MRLAFKIPAYVFGIIAVIIIAGFYVYYFTTLPEAELNNWIGSLVSSEEDITISVRRVNRDVWNHLMLEGVSVAPREEDRAPTAYISKIELDYDIVTILQNKNIYRSLVIDTVLVKFPPSIAAAGEKDKEKSVLRLPVDASINRVYINLIDMTLANGERIILNGLALSASAQNDKLDIELNNLSGRWPARDVLVHSILGNFSYDPEGVSVKDLNITTSRSSVNLQGRTGHNFFDDIDISFDCNPISLDEIRDLSGVNVNGSLEVSGTIKGSLADFTGKAIIDGLFFGRRFEDLNLIYGYSDKIFDFEGIDGKIFDSVFRGTGRLDFSTMPETYSYRGRVEHLNLVNIGPDLETDFSGIVDMNGRGMGENSFFMKLDCELDSVRIDEFYFDEINGPFDLDLTRLRFHDGFGGRYKNTSISATGTMEYDGNISIQGDAQFQDLTDFTGQIFLKNLGGRGKADFSLSGPTADFDIRASFFSDSCWTYGLEPGEIFVDIDLNSFISHRVGTVHGFWRGGELYSVQTDSGYFTTSVSGDRVFIDTAYVNSLEESLWMRGGFDGTTVPPIFRVDTLWTDIRGIELKSREPLLFALYDNETEFTKFRLLFGSGSVELDGIVTSDLEMDLNFKAEGFQIRPAMGLIYGEREVEGLFSGSAKIKGTFDDPMLDAFINVDSIEIDNIPIGRFEAEADYEDGYLVTKKGMLETLQGNYEFFGKLPMNLAFEEVDNRFPDDPIEMQMTASGNRLILSEVFISSIDTFNTAYSVNMAFTGTYDNPRITGEGYFNDGELKILELETPLTGLNARFRMENEIITIVDATATVSAKQTRVDEVLDELVSVLDKREKKALVRASGTIKLFGLADFLYDLDVSGEYIFFKSDQYDISGICDFNLDIEGPTPPVVSGDIIFSKLDIREEFDSFYDPELDAAGAAIEDSSSWDLDLDIYAQNNIWIKNSEVDAEFKADMHVERNVGILGILGTLEVLRGDYKGILYSLTGRKFETKSGMMTFNNVSNINPEIDFVVSTRLRSRETEASITEVELNITGTLFEPRINTTEASALSKEDVIRLLVENNLVTSGGTGNLVENAGVLFQSMGVDPFTAQGLLEEVEIGRDERDQEKTRISVAKYISPDLYLRYSQRFSADDPGRVIGVEYYLYNNLLLKASQGQQGSDYEGISLDINLNVEF